jgi:hypothetical protein
MNAEITSGPHHHPVGKVDASREVTVKVVAAGVVGANGARPGGGQVNEAVACLTSYARDALNTCHIPAT